MIFFAIILEFKNKFETKTDIKKNEQELRQIYKDTEFMVKAIINMKIHYRDNI